MSKNNCLCTTIWFVATFVIASVVGVRASTVVAQAVPVTDSAAAAALSAHVHGFVNELAAQRDAIGGWPNAVQTVFNALSQLATDLDAAVAAGDRPLVRRRYQRCVRLGARISRWLANYFDPTSDQLPPADRVDVVITRLTERLELIKALAGRAQITLDLNAVNAARLQVDDARGRGAAQMIAALRALRDAVDNLQDALPEPTN
jgi:hypothetical protein